METEIETDETNGFHFLDSLWKSGELQEHSSPSRLFRLRYSRNSKSELADVPADVSTWSHKNGIPPKDIAELMGHAVVHMQFEYSVAMDS